MAADFFETILIAANCPVTECFASLTRPLTPVPSVLPSCHGPTCVFLLPWLVIIDAADITELRLVPGCEPGAGLLQLTSASFADRGLVTMDIGTGDVICCCGCLSGSSRSVIGARHLFTLAEASVKGVRIVSGVRRAVSPSICPVYRRKSQSNTRLHIEDSRIGLDSSMPCCHIVRNQKDIDAYTSEWNDWYIQLTSSLYRFGVVTHA